MKELGYQDPCMAYYYKKPNTDLDNGLTELAVDKDVCEMLMYVDKFKVIELYTHHSVNKKHVLIQEPLVLGTTSEPNEPDIGFGSEVEVDVSEDEWLQEALKKLPIKSKKGSGSGSNLGSENGSDSSSGSDSEDSDYFVDEENLIDDVDVDMAEFKSHTDPDVEWVGCKETVVEENEVFDLKEVDHDEFDSRSDSDEDARRKALRKVATMNKANLVKEKNPNTTIKIEVAPPEVPDSEERKFKRIYICLGPLKDGFRAGGRDFLGLDGCFLSGPYPGQILTAVGVDPNNRIYPLAYAIVESEYKDSWKWFLDGLGDDLELFRNSNFTFISDRQKGVIPAIAETFPSAEHRFCVKHIYDNMKLSWRGKLYKELLWKCATATTIQKFDKRMEEMKNHNIEAYEWARQLVDGRDKPIKTCLEYIREYLMKRIVNVQKVQDKCDGPLTPNAAKIFKLIEKAAAKLKVDWNVAAIWDMTSNGTDTGIPESYCNPYVPTTIIPPKSHPQIARPPKKRKKSAAELADEIMSKKSGDAGAGSQGGGDSGVGGS
ncbi:mutator type transposase [Tanacetum coccineum]